MGDRQPAIILRHLRQLVAEQQTGDSPDGELVQRFAAEHDEAAFGALLRRHGPMVLGVCRRVLGHEQDAEDAFQATFLVLTRKAGCLRRQESVGSWLYGVAHRLALKARAEAGRRHARESRVPGRAPADPLAEITARELVGTLDQELTHLPQKYRAPLILCCLEGTTRNEAAKQLRWSVSTLKRRLERGRELLRVRLARRGLALSAALSVPLLDPSAGQAAVPAVLRRATMQGALSAAPGQVAGVSARATALAGGMLKTMAVAKVTLAAALLVAVGAVSVGAGALARQVLAPTEFPWPAAVGKQPGPGAPQADKERTGNVPAAAPDPAEAEQITVTGSVLGPREEPLAEAQVALLGLPKDRARSGFKLLDEKILAQTRTGADGRFRLTLPQPALAPYAGIYVLAGKAGHGPVWEPVALKGQAAQTVLRLPPEKIIRGRLVDLQGQPAVGVPVEVSWLGTTVPVEVGGSRIGMHHKDSASLWPSPAVTDRNGTFTIKGLNPHYRGYLQIRSDRFAPQEVEIKSGAESRLQEVNLSLAPAQIIEGAVTAADTGKPVPHAQLQLNSSENADVSEAMGPGVNGQADDKGHYRLNPPPGKLYTIYTTGPDGSPYLRLKTTFKWPKGAVKHQLNLALQRGVLVRGKVTEADSGKPVAGAVVHNAAHLWIHYVTTGPDGVFQMPVPPGRGHLLVKGPGNAYIALQVTDGDLSRGKPSGYRFYPDAVIPFEARAGSDVLDVRAKLRPGVTIKGRVVGPDDRPVAEGVLLCWNQLPRPDVSTWFGAAVAFQDGRCELRGCDPAETYPVYFLDAQHQLGASVQLSVKEAGAKPVTVRLAPCGSAVARFVDRQGKPLAHFRPLFYFVARPAAKGVQADSDFVANVDRLHYAHGRPAVDAEGRCTFPALIPGATYRVLNYNLESVKDFTVQAGETLKLPDIVIDSPK